MYSCILPREITYRLPRRDSDRIPSFFRVCPIYTNRYESSTPSPIVLFRTNGKLLSRLVYISCANCISLILESRAKAFVLSFYFLTFFMESLESAFPAVSNRRNVIKSRNVFLTFFMESLDSAFPVVSSRRNVIKSRNVGHVITKKIIFLEKRFNRHFTFAIRNSFFLIICSASSTENQNEFLLSRALIFRKGRKENVMKRYDFINVVLKCLVFIFSAIVNTSDEVVIFTLGDREKSLSIMQKKGTFLLGGPDVLS